MEAKGNGDLDFRLWLDDRLLAGQDSFLLRADEQMDLQLAAGDQWMLLRYSVSDEDSILHRDWRLRIIGGFHSFPESGELETVEDQAVVFQLGMDSGDEMLVYEFFVNGELMHVGPEYCYPAEDPGGYMVEGIARLGEKSWSRGWHLTVTEGQVLDPPGEISELRVGPGSEPGLMTIAFMPPMDRLREDVAFYEVRGHPQPIEVELFHTAYLMGFVAAAEGQEEEERYELPAYQAGIDYHVRVRSVGYSGTTSEWSDLASGRVRGYSVSGVFLDYETGLPQEGINVLYRDVADVSDAEGRYHCTNVPFMAPANPLEPPGRYYDDHYLDPGLGDWFDVSDSTGVADSLNCVFGSFRVEPFLSVMYDDFLYYLRHMVNADAWYPRGLVRPSYPITVFAPELVNDGLDYRQAIWETMGVWETQTGLNLFVVESDPAEAVLSFAYDDTMSVTGLIEILGRDPHTLSPNLMRITLTSTFTGDSEVGMKRVVLHELGHALGMWAHSEDMNHVMNYHNSHSVPHQDELRLMRVLYHLPIGFRLEDLLHN